MNISKQEAHEIPLCFVQPLQVITAALQDGKVDWAITGSLGFALQGVPVELAPIRHWVDYWGMHLPVLSLAYEHQAYLHMGRIEKARLLQKFIHQRE